MNKITYIFALFTTALLSQNIIIDDQRTAEDLVQNVLFNNTACANVSDVMITGGDFGTGENSFGYFDGNGSSFSFAEGIVLTTGKANHASGPNDFISSDGDASWGPDTNANGTSDLEEITGVSNTLNATVLEFDFIPDSDFISFKYIFASEEYRQNEPTTCTFSDEFVFLIKPVGFGNYTNIALVPGTNTRISVLNVHPTIFSDGFVACLEENEEYFDQFNDVSAPINYNGQTTIMTAQTDVIVGEQYHIKIIIADDENSLFDSAVFIGGSGVSFSELNLGSNFLISNGTALCPGETIQLDAGNATEYQWFKDGVDLFFDNQYLNVNEPGVYEVIVGDTICASVDSIVVEYDTFPTVINAPLATCVFEDNDSGTYNLYDAFDVITNNNSSLIIEGFYYSLENAQDSPDTTAIPNPDNFVDNTTNHEIIVRVVNNSGCVSFAKIILFLGLYPDIAENESLLYCLNDFPNTITLYSGLLDLNVNDFSFIWSTGETTQDIEVNVPGEYVVTITRIIDNCSLSRTIIVESSNIATFNKVLVADMDNKDRVSITVIVSGQGDYEYAIDDNTIFQDSNTFEFLTYGVHTIFIRDKNGCLPITEEIFVLLDNPSFFTPNGDGNYDFWNINNLNSLDSEFNSISNITIFDRFGKTMAVLNPYGIGWNGNHNGEPVPPNDYWFSVELINFKGETIIKNGHFSLSR